MKRMSSTRERGITLIGLIFLLAIFGLIGLLGLKVVPTVIEFQSIKKAIVASQQDATTPADIQRSFDKRANVGYIEAISGKDLTIVRNSDNGFDVSFAYDKKIPLVGPASLLLEYEGTTAKPTQTKTIE
jgi:type II secretory pathway pseudopilin PulG